MKVEVKGIVDGQEIYWGYSADVKLIEITSDGTYDIPPLETVNGNLSFRNGNIAGYCNITITQLPSGQSVPTNEILKANPFLQDHSGNNRQLKLNNFLFAAMSGVGGYSYFSEDIVKTSSNWYEVLYRGSNNGASLSFSITGITDLNSKNPQRGKIEILDTDASKVIQTIISDGEYNTTIPSSTTNFSIRFGGGTQGEVIPCDVVISPIPLYPNSLVTDGVDDYGVVENFEALQNYMMFFQCAIIRPNTSKGMFSTKAISNNQGWMLCQNQGKNITRFGNNTYMNFESSANVENKINYVLTADSTIMTLSVGDELQTLNDTWTTTGNEMGFFISDYSNTTRFGSIAFYKSILLDTSTLENEGITLTEISNYINKSILNS